MGPSHRVLYQESRNVRTPGAAAPVLKNSTVYVLRTDSVLKYALASGASEYEWL